ncbi:MAG: 30S ribosomal protein S12 methylthiotransferase RimO [Treponema sp.]|nr:30S ribosomal protein S12 methylthiotransferase RimO [Treponema sp.]
MTSKKFFLDQHGCAKNQVDGELILTHLEQSGYVKTDNPEDADLIIINSCGFIESAKTESLNSLMDARKSFPKAKILLAGCLAERYADVFKTELMEADGIFGNGDISKVTETVNKMFSGERPVIKPPQNGVCCGNRNTLLNFKGSAYVKITEGCNNCCTFCAIPLIRGSLRSRKASEITEEITELVSKGTKEINLIGQDLAAYGTGKEDRVFDSSSSSQEHSFLYSLMEEISKISGNFWVRLLYIHPDHFNPDILEIMKKDSRFLPYFDIPFQSGADSIIKAMNRKGTSLSYQKLVQTIRSAFPESSIRTTFLTGFPGETEQDHNSTKEFLTAIQSDWSGCFSYSTEEGTPAAKMKGKVSKKAAEKRAGELVQIQSKITEEKLAERVGKTYDVLVEEIIENNDGTDEGLAIGRAWFEAPEVDGSFVIRYDLDDKEAVEAIKSGNVVKVKAIASSAVDIDGEYIGK